MSVAAPQPKPFFAGRTFSEWFASLPAFLLLIFTLMVGVGEMVQSKLLDYGESRWPQYFKLRYDLPAPSCDANLNVDAAVQRQMAAGGGGGDAIDALFADAAPRDANSIRQSVLGQLAECKTQHQAWADIQVRITPEVKAYRYFETRVQYVVQWTKDYRPLILMVLLAVCSLFTTLGRHHISLRPPTTVTDFRVYGAFMVAANAMLLFSTASHLFSPSFQPELVIEQYMYWVWVVLFGAMTLVSVGHMLKPPREAEAGGSINKALLAVPMYAVMALIAGINFSLQTNTAGDHYVTGLAIYLSKLPENSSIFLSLALYLWAGMLLKQTGVVNQFLDVLRPWNLSPVVLTYIILVAAAVPTAYTGASGVFVIAGGAVIYREIMRTGAGRQFALAATAMSGSLGVVLKPCLLVVLIAAMNKQVTTAELYGWGLKVFLLTSTLFLIIAGIMSKAKFRVAPVRTALPGSLRALVPLAPYAVVIGAVILGFRYFLGVKMDEFNAAIFLPLILLVVVIFDKLRRDPPKPAGVTMAEGERRVGLEEAIRVATTDTLSHIGALILLMALSVSIGGMIERSGMMEVLPTDLGSVWLAMTLLVGLLIIVGMLMDPFGAVILVSGTIAPIAYQNGINPVHFWMVVLTAFELGYLSPPVALNQLLTRQVVGEGEFKIADAEVAQETSFYRRYERWILPCLVMFTGLMIVAYGPLIYQQFIK